jgi:hypothetical protein
MSNCFCHFGFRILVGDSKPFLGVFSHKQVIQFFLLFLFLSELAAVEETHDWTTLNCTFSVGSS